MTAASFQRDLIASAELTEPKVRDHASTARIVAAMVLDASPKSGKFGANRRMAHKRLKNAVEALYSDEYDLSPIVIAIIAALVQALLEWWFADKERGTEFLRRLKAT